MAGAVVYQADGPANALATLAMLTPHVLISDIAMPDVDGYWLLRRVRQLGNRRKRSIPAIALTALSRDVDEARALASGFDRHMAKPLNPARLIETVQTLARSRRAEPVRH